jgi:hypothetical protein
MATPSPENVTVSIALAIGEDANGAGWLLPNGRIVTCNHVVEEVEEVWVRFGEGPPRKYRVGPRLPQGTTTDPTPVDTGDLALLSSSDDAEKWQPISRYIADRPVQDSTVVSFGFPKERPNGRSGDGTVGASVKGRREIVSASTPQQSLTQGFSGAPVVAKASSRVLGLFSATHHESGRGYLIPAADLRKWLRDEGDEESASFFSIPAEWPTRALNQIRGAVFGKDSPEVEYDLRIMRQESGSGLPRPEQPTTYADEHLSPLAFVQEARIDGGCSVVFADGGGGKSSYLFQFAQELEAAAVDYVWLDLKTLFNPDSQQLTELLGRSDPARFEELVNKSAVTPLPKNFSHPEQLVVFIADGLNEVGASAQALFTALHAFVRITGNVSLVATARSTTGLRLAEETSAYALVPVSESEIERVTRRSGLKTPFRRLLGKPQLLDLAVKLGAFNNPHQSAIFKSYLEGAVASARTAGGWSSDSDRQVLDALGLHAFGMLAAGSLTLSNGAWIASLTESLRETMAPSVAATQMNPKDIATRLTQELIGQSVLTSEAPSGGEATTIGFQHSLIAEWLAARHFVSLGPEGWTSNGFKAVTIEDSSDDALRLATEMVDRSRRETFLLRMYDWRWQRVLDLATGGSAGLSPPLLDALIGLNALRLRDWFQHTRTQVRPFIQRAAEAGSEFAGRLLAASDEPEGDLLSEVRARFERPEATDSGAYDLDPWRALLRIVPPAGQEGVDALVSEDAFIGWSASNFLRLIGVQADAMDAMRAAYLASLATARSISRPELAEGFDPLEAGVGLRWRIAHAVGRAILQTRADDAIQFLFSIWEDEGEHRDVRFGACRSLLELALANPGKRDDIFDRFLQVIAHWSGPPADDKKWRDDSLKAAEQLWRAWPPVEDRLSMEDRRQWNEALYPVLEAAGNAADALEWPREALDATLKKIQEERG